MRQKCAYLLYDKCGFILNYFAKAMTMIRHLIITCKVFIKYRHLIHCFHMKVVNNDYCIHNSSVL